MDKKKKKHRQAAGVLPSSLQDAQDIFGDVEELLDMRRRANLEKDRYDENGLRKERNIGEEFEPTILAERYMTEKDDRIRDIDIPERMQVNCFSKITLYLNSMLLHFLLKLLEVVSLVDLLFTAADMTGNAVYNSL